MAITQFQQFAGLIWLFILFLSYFLDKSELAAIDSILGIFLGLDMANESFIFLIFMFTVNLWILYDALYRRT